MNREHGYTLMETLVTLTLMMILSVGVIAQENQEIPHLNGGLPQSLLLLPALPAVQARRPG
jgi:hypothetical protein